MQSVGEQLGSGNLETFRSHPALVSADALGVELELEGFTSSATELASRHLAPLWTVKGDGSLRNGGVEFVTNGGLGGQQLHAALERITTLLATRVDYDASLRCSTHMHVNMKDFTVPQVAAFLMVYAACEPVLFAHCGNYRRSSNFCVPVGDSLPFHKTLIGRMYDDVVKTRYAAKHTQKYTALNLQPLFGSERIRALGTVEFRGGRPLTTMTEFLTQANLLLSIKEFVRNGPADHEGLLKAINDDVRNSVYSSGVASDLNVQIQDLENALINAWILCKAYQEGMKTPPKSKATIPEGLTNWNPSGTNMFSTAGLRPMGVDGEFAGLQAVAEVFGYYNQAVVPQLAEYNTQTQFGPDYNPFPDAVWPRFNRYIGHLSSNTKMEGLWWEYLYAITASADGGELLKKEVDSLVIAWLLVNKEASIIPAMTRSVIERRDSGRHVSLIPGLQYNEQPNMRFTSSQCRRRMDWIAHIPADTKTEISRHFIGGAFDQCAWSLFYSLSTIRVRVKNRNVLSEILQQKIIDFSHSIEEYMPVTQLFHLLAIAQAPSATHVFRFDLDTYDRYAGIMDLLYSAGVTVPVLVKSGPTSLGTLFLSCNRNCSIGYIVRDERVEGRPARTSPNTNLQVY